VSVIASEDDIFAQRGQGVITQEQFDAAAARIPAERRQEFLRSRSRLERFVDQTLITAQIAAEARVAGFEETPEVRARMEWAANEELARAWLAKRRSELPPADYETMAREEWLLNGDSYMTEPTIDVSHILIKAENRTAEDARFLAEELRARLNDDPSLFDEFVAEYSEDSSAAANKGRFYGVRRGQMVRPFEVAAFGMEPGEISGPVKTQYGFHIIRLDALEPARKQSFEEVRERLVEQMRSRHREAAEVDYLSTLASEEVVLTEDALREMVVRQFGEDAVVPAEEPVQSE
jgi:parvulin-like peptidyl-prolyl isomerase